LQLSENFTIDDVPSKRLSGVLCSLTGSTLGLQLKPIFA
jgi:hypothetical protein